MSLARYYVNERARKGDLGKLQLVEKGDEVGWGLKNRIGEVGAGNQKAQRRV